MRKDYKTSQREILTQFFKSSRNKCFTADEVLKFAVANGLSVGQTTIYRNLEKLSEQGVLIKHTMSSGNSAFYQYIENCDDKNEHFHFLCTSCGQIECVPCKMLSDAVSHLKTKHNFKFDTRKTVLYGVCAKCDEHK
jgi:Fur family ferric uptake transcriptional regulator